jgi:hypothetical protein
VIKPGYVHTKMESKAWRWMKGEQLIWTKLSLGKEERAKTKFNGVNAKDIIEILFFCQRGNRVCDQV